MAFPSTHPPSQTPPITTRTCNILYDYIYQSARSAALRSRAFSIFRCTALQSVISRGVLGFFIPAYLIYWYIKYHPNFGTRIRRAILGTGLGCYVLSPNMYQYMLAT